MQYLAIFFYKDNRHFQQLSITENVVGVATIIRRVLGKRDKINEKEKRSEQDVTVMGLKGKIRYSIVFAVI